MLFWLGAAGVIIFWKPIFQWFGCAFGVMPINMLHSYVLVIGYLPARGDLTLLAHFYLWLGTIHIIIHLMYLMLLSSMWIETWFLIWRSLSSPSSSFLQFCLQPAESCCQKPFRYWSSIPKIFVSLFELACCYCRIFFVCIYFCLGVLVCVQLNLGLGACSLFRNFLKLGQQVCDSSCADLYMADLSLC